MSHYAPDDDIAWLVLEGYEGGRADGERHEWGLVERDRETGRVVAFEVWHASQRLPAEMLAALPEPAASEVHVDRGDGSTPRAA